MNIYGVAEVQLRVFLTSAADEIGQFDTSVTRNSIHAVCFLCFSAANRSHLHAATICDL